MDIISYILSKRYCDNAIVGLGAIRGANCTVKDIVHQDGINTVTFEWTGTDGTKKTRDMVVYDGTPIYVWESGNTYHYGDLAIYESQFYRCIVENSDVTFDNTKWNEIGSPDGNYDIVQSKALLPARFTAADRKLYFVIDECIFYLWDGYQWVALNHAVQVDTFPTPSAKYFSKIYQYIGTTDANYIHGYFYQCVPTVVSGETVYNWVRQDVQPSHPYVQSDWAQDNSNANDYIKNKPTLGTASAKNYTSNVRPNNTDLVESHAVYSAINSALSSIYVPRGELSCAELTADLLIPANVGNVYTMSDSGTTSALFINGAGHSIAVNDNVGIIRAGGDTILFNLMGNAFDLHDYQTKELETPLTIDGTQETEVESALSGLNEAVDKRVSYKYNGIMGAKNFNVTPYYNNSTTINNIEFTVNDDGSVTANGTASADANFVCHTHYNETNALYLADGTYIVSGCPKNMPHNVSVAVMNNEGAWAFDTGNGATFTVNNASAAGDNLKLSVTIRIPNGTVIDNITFYPMIRLAEDTDDTWQPYAKTNKQLTEDINELKLIDHAEKIVNITAFGGQANNTTDANSAKLIEAINYAMINKYTLYVPIGVFTINSPIVITNDLIIEGQNSFGVYKGVGSSLKFAPSANNTTMFSDNNSQKHVSIRHINLCCDYAHFTSNSSTEAQESPYEYFSWTYDYDNVNCLDLAKSMVDLDDVGICGFSGYGAKLFANRTISNVKILGCKWGFYNCGTDVIFNTCFVSQTEKAFYWDGGVNATTVLFIYDTWIDQCGYGVYSTGSINGTLTGLIDHCLYAAIYAKGSYTGLNVDARIGRCGMYYTGTDMLTHAPSTYSDADFDDMSKGVFIAIKNSIDINLKINVRERPIDDAETGTSKLPTLLVYGNRFSSAVIQTSNDLGERTYKLHDTTSQVNVINCKDRVTYEYQGKVGAKNLLSYPYYVSSRTFNGISWDSTVTNDGRIVVNGQPTGYTNYEMYYDSGSSNSIDLKLKAGDYIASIGGCDNNENIMFRIRLVYPDPETGTTITKANVTRQTQYKIVFNISEQEADDLANGIAHFEGRVYCPDASTEVFDNLVISPMLRYAEDSSDIWQPYAKTNKELTDGLSNLISTLNVTNISEKKIDITAFGGKADVNSSDNSQLLISAITYAMANGYTLYVPQGIYYIKSGVEITNDLKIEGVTTYGQSGQRIGSVIHFAPQTNDVTMFYDNGSHNISLKNVQFFCSYTHFTQSFEEVVESPHAYLTWSYDYTNVNCLNISNSLLDIYNVGISGFSGYAIKCKSNRVITNVKIGACKYGFYECGTDVVFHDCYLSQCEYAFYWLTQGTVIFSYDTWIDLCGYGYYSEKELSGEISGLIDHCLYAGIRAKHTQSGLNFNGRMGRCGMYYTGTDMLEFLSGSFTEEKFIEATKGVFVAIRDAKGLNLNINVYPRALDDQNLGENKLPTLICYGQKFESAIIKTSHNYGNHTYLVTNTADSHVNVINCDGSDTMVEFTAQELLAMW